MLGGLCKFERYIAIVASVSGVLWYIAFGSFANASFAGSLVICLLNLLIIFFADDANDRDTKTILVAMTLIATMTLFTLALVLSGIPTFMFVFMATMTGIVIFVVARFVQRKDPRLSTGLLFLTLFPFGFLITEALMRAQSSSRKKGT